MSTEALTGQQVEDAGLDGWAFLLHYGTHGLQTRIHTDTFATGVQLVGSIGQAAEELNRHADLDLRRSRVDVRLTGDGSGVTELDVSLSRRISDLAAAAGAEIECASLAQLELGLDTPDWTRIGPFWVAVLNGELVTGDDWADVGDRNRVLPLIWFQPCGSEEPRQRWHPDIWIDPTQLQPRIDSALAAGGQLVGGDDLSNGCTLSDPQGNKVCLCTWRGRA